MNGRGLTRDAEEGLEEIVIRGANTPKAGKGVKKEPRSPGRRLSRSAKQSDSLDTKPLLEDAQSEPSERLQYFAVNNRLFQPHDRGHTEVVDAAVAFGDGAPELLSSSGLAGGLGTTQSARQSIDDSCTTSIGGALQQRASATQDSFWRPPHSLLSPLKTKISASRVSGGEGSSSISSPGGGQPTQAGNEGPKRTGSSTVVSPPEYTRVSQREMEVPASPGLDGIGSVINTARPPVKPLARNESLSSNKSIGFRSSFKGERSRGLLRAPTLELSDAKSGLRTPQGPPEPSVQLPDARASDLWLTSRGGLPKAVTAAPGLAAPRMSRRVSWLEVGEPPPAGTPVMDHAVAGDLHVGCTPKIPTPAEAQNNSHACKNNGTAGDRDKGKSKEELSNLPSCSTDLQFEDEKGNDAEAAAETQEMTLCNFWSHWVFWSRWMPAFLTLILFVMGWGFFIWKHNATVVYFEVWRWCFFLSCILPIYWISHVVVHLLVIAVESTLFTTKQVLYYTYGVRKPLARFLRVCLVLPIFVACFSGGLDNQKVVSKAYSIMTRILGCAILFFFANVLRSLMAKLLATHFHREAHFKKMQQALRKEYYLMALSQPRVEELPEKPGEDEGTGEEEGGVPVEDAKEMLADKLGASKVYSQLKKNFGNSKKMGTLPDLVQAEAERAKEQLLQERKRPPVRPASPWGAAVVPPGNPQAGVPPSPFPAQSPRLGGHPLPERPSWQQPMKPFYGQPSMLSLAQSMAASRASKATRRDDASGFSSVARSLRTGQSLAAKASQKRGGKFLLRTAAFKKDVPLGRSVTNLTSALDDVKDADDSAKFNGELIQKLHVAEKHIRKNKLKVTFADQLGSAAHTPGDRQVGSVAEAKRLAFFLFWNIKPYFDRNFILQEDIEYFLPPHCAAQAFELLDVDQDGRVSLHDIRDAILRIYKERKDLAFTLKDTKTIVGKIETIITVIVHVLFIMFYLVIFEVDVSKVWISFSSILVAFSFIFAKTISDMFASVVFLFVVHPFDVGDGILIGSDLHFVEEISLQNCLLRRWDGAKIWYPNLVMQAAPVTNISRSGCKWESFTMFVDIRTPSAVFNLLNEKIEGHMEVNASEFTGEYACCNFGCSDPEKLKLGVYFEYSHTGVDTDRVTKARHGLATCICDALYALDVKYDKPSFTGPRPPWAGTAAAPGSQVATVVQQAAKLQTLNPLSAYGAAVGAQFPGPRPTPRDVPQSLTQRKRDKDTS